MNTFTPIDEIRDAKQRKKTRQAFYTPLSVVELMLAELPLYTGCRALEPSAGDGRIVHAILQTGAAVDACEVDPAMYARCEAMGADMIDSDFLHVMPRRMYDAIAMNPPFTKGQAKKHIEHAYKMLKPNGRLAAIAPVSLREQMLSGELNLEGCEHASYERLPAETFKESGASVETLLITACGPTVMPEVCGFTNGATANAAFTVTSTRKLLESRNRQQALVEIGDFGGSVYGIDWDEVDQYVTEVSS